MRHRKRLRHTGFSIVELLVAIAIISVLMALLLPAVQQARESARQLSCRNNLKQIGVALHNYHDLHKQFPNASVWGYYPPGKPGESVPRNYTWIVMILPYLEQEPLYSAIDFSRPVYDTTGATQIDSKGDPVSAATLPVLMCPSDSRYVSCPNQISWTNYAGATPFWALGWGAKASTQGVFTDFRNTSLRDIRDGTSNTIMVGETSTYGFIGGAPWTTAQGDSRTLKNAFYHTAICSVSSKSVYPGTSINPKWPDGNGGGWGWKGDAHPYAGDPTYLAIAGINGDWYGATSVHPGGAHFLMADGAVRFISEMIDFREPFSAYIPSASYDYSSVWMSLNTRSGPADRELPIRDF